MAKNSHLLVPIDNPRHTKIKRVDTLDSSDDEWKRLTESDIRPIQHQKCHHMFKYIEYKFESIHHRCRNCNWNIIIDPNEKCILCSNIILECECEDYLYSPLITSDKCSKIDYFSKAIRHFLLQDEIEELFSKLI